MESFTNNLALGAALAAFLFSFSASANDSAADQAFRACGGKPSQTIEAHNKLLNCLQRSPYAASYSPQDQAYVARMQETSARVRLGEDYDLAKAQERQWRAAQLETMQERVAANIRAQQQMQAQTNAIESLPLSQAQIYTGLQATQSYGRAYVPEMRQTNF